MRCFLAIPLPPVIKDVINQLVEELKLNGVNAKFVDKDNVHITVKFLGKLRETDIERVKTQVNNVNVSRFSIQLHGLGCFPDLRHPRALWIGIKDGRLELDALLNSFDTQTAHVTIARFGDLMPGIDSIIDMNKNRDFGSFDVDRIILFESRLTSKGPIYTKLWERLL